MNNEIKKIKSFTDLNAWKEAHKFVLLIYQITNQFPNTEQFGLTNQIRRAVVSVTSNMPKVLVEIHTKKNPNFIPWL